MEVKTVLSILMLEKMTLAKLSQLWSQSTHQKFLESYSMIIQVWIGAGVCGSILDIMRRLMLTNTLITLGKILIDSY